MRAHCLQAHHVRWRALYRLAIGFELVGDHEPGDLPIRYHLAFLTIISTEPCAEIERIEEGVAVCVWSTTMESIKEGFLFKEVRKQMPKVGLLS